MLKYLTFPSCTMNFMFHHVLNYLFLLLLWFMLLLLLLFFFFFFFFFFCFCFLFCAFLSFCLFQLFLDVESPKCPVAAPRDTSHRFWRGCAHGPWNQADLYPMLMWKIYFIECKTCNPKPVWKTYPTLDKYGQKLYSFWVPLWWNS